MLLKSKIGLILVLIFVLYGVIDFGIQRFIIFPSFISLEREEAIKNSKRSEEAIRREIYHLDSLCHDWAAWDDTYEFIESRSDEYIEANLVLATFTDTPINIIYFSDTKGRIVWGKIYDLENEKYIQLPEFPKEVLPENHLAISYKLGNTPLSDVKISGVYMTQKGPMLFASRPILNSDNEGPVRGSLIMGRFLDDEIVKTLVDQTQVNFQVLPIKAGSLPESVKDIPRAITDESGYLIKTSSNDFVDSYTTFPDIKGDAALLIHSKTPRKISEKGYATMHYAMYSVLGAGLGILAVMLLLLQRTVLKPITELTDHTLSVGKTGDLSGRLFMQRRDEIGTLASEFDNMLVQLEKRSVELEAMNNSLKDEIVERKRIEKDLQVTVTDLKKASTEIKTLRGILPLCSFCKKIRDDKGYWEKVDVYIHKYSQADISHSICPDCMEKHYPEEYQSFLNEDE